MKSKAMNNVALSLRLLGDARPYWGHLFLIFLLNLMSTPLALLTPFPVKLAVDSVLGDKPVPDFLRIAMPANSQNSPAMILMLACVFTFLVMFALAAQAFLAWVYQLYVGEKLVMNTRARIFEHVQRLSLRHHDEKGAPDLLYRVQNDVFNMQYMAIYGLIPLATSSVMFVTMFLITFRLDWQLSLLAIAILPVLWIVGRSHAKRSRMRWAEVKESERRSVTVIQEVFNCIRIVKAFARERSETEKFLSRAEANLSRYMEAIWTETAFGLVIAGAIAVASAIAIWLGVKHVQAGSLSLGNFLVTMAYLAQLFKPLEVFSKQAATTQASLASADRAYALLDETPDIRESSDALAMPRARGDVEFRNVEFRYRPDQDGLKNISFHAPAGSRIAIVGQTGAGKTTLINLLVRFFDPTAGSVLLDGHDLRDIRLSDLRRQFAMVLQDCVLFSGTILENIAYGKPHASRDEIFAAARSADAHDFIMSLPDGYDTLVGEKGMSLSGGERQRISIARAFLLDAPVLVLDEPTSSVDVEREQVIASALAKLQRGRTTFTISHRFSLIEDYDLILTLKNGRLTHATETTVQELGL